MGFAAIFPGQGSQSVGMLAGLADRFPAVEAAFAEASDTLGYDLWRVCQEGPEERLNATECTQPAMLAAGVAVWRVWREEGGSVPDAMAGHSLGEYSALVCADAVAFPDAIALVAARGRFMQEAVPAGEGAVAAVLGLDDAEVEAACRAAERSEVVRPVNFNAPGQVVLAGHTAAVERAIGLAREAGARRAVLLPLSVPVHSPLMKPAADRFEARLREIEFAAPALPVVANVGVEPHGDPASIRDRLLRQLFSPVPWAATVRRLAESGVDRVVEPGPGRVLAGLNRRIERGMAAHAVFDPASLEAALEAAGGG